MLESIETEERTTSACELAAALYLGAVMSPPIDLPVRVKRRLVRESTPTPAPPHPSRLTPSYLAPPASQTPPRLPSVAPKPSSSLASKVVLAGLVVGILLCAVVGVLMLVQRLR